MEHVGKTTTTNADMYQLLLGLHLHLIYVVGHQQQVLGEEVEQPLVVCMIAMSVFLIIKLTVIESNTPAYPCRVR